MPPGSSKDRVRRSKRKFGGKLASVIWYIKTNKAKMQSIRFPRRTWTAAQARAVCKKLGGTFEAAAPAKAAKSMTDRITEFFGDLHERLSKTGGG